MAWPPALSTMRAPIQLTKSMRFQYSKNAGAPRVSPSPSAPSGSLSVRAPIGRSFSVAISVPFLRESRVDRAVDHIMLHCRHSFPYQLPNGTKADTIGGESLALLPRGRPLAQFPVRGAQGPRGPARGRLVRNLRDDEH